MSPNYSLVALAFFFLGGCSQTATVSVPVRIGSTPAIMTTADLRTITERPLPYRNRKIVCTEPPPDVAKALSTAFSGSASGSAAGGAGGSGAVSDATAESLAELTGRVPGLIALRDTLFRACEGYANGMIGDDVYGLITSRYGELLVTLMLAEAMQARPTAATLQGIVLGASIANQTPGNTPNKSGQGGTPLPDSGAPAKKQPAASLDHAAGTLVVDVSQEANGDLATARRSHDGRIQLTSLTPMLAQIAVSGPVNPPADAGAKVPAEAAAKPPAAAAAKPPAGAGAKPVAGDTPNPSSSDAAAILQQMQQNFLSIGLVQPIIVACINEWDATRAAYRETGSTYPPSTNPLLNQQFCARAIDEAMKLQGLQAWVNAQATLKKAGATIALPLSLLSR
jgi:hypothetical protein